MKKISQQQVQQCVSLLNPHWKNGYVDDEYRKKSPRKYFDLFFPLVNQFDVRRAVILMGPRRVGKTVLLWHCIQKFLEQGHEASDLLYLSLDAPLLHQFSLQALLDYYKKIHAMENLDKKIIIFDEVQYLKKWDVQLKFLVDQNPETKFITSGSAAGALQRKSMESGAGRFTDFILPPLTFFEYLELLKVTKSFLIIKEDPFDFQIKEIEQLNQEFINYLNYGGFPEAVFNETIRQDPQRFIRSDIIDKVLLRDLPSLYGIQDTQELNRFFSTLVYQTGNEISYDGLSQASGVAKNTIRKYLDYLEAAFLIKCIKRIDDSAKIFKRANYFKVYLTNPSMYAAIYGNVSPDETQTLGCLVETAIFSQWMHSPDEMSRIFYARWKGGKGEVDMVYLDRNFKALWCLEIKWRDKVVDDPTMLKNLIHFAKKHKSLQKITVTTRTKKTAKTINEVPMQFVEAASQCLIVGYKMIKKRESHSFTSP